MCQRENIDIGQILCISHHAIDLKGNKMCLKIEQLQSGANIKQLLDEVEHDIMNYQNRGLC